MLNSNALYVSQCIATDLVHVSYEPSRFSPFSLRSRHFHSPFYEHSTLFRRAKISTKLHANTTPILRNLATSPSHPVCDSSHDVTLRICHLSRDNSKRREPVREETKVMENTGIVTVDAALWNCKWPTLPRFMNSFVTFVRDAAQFSTGGYEERSEAKVIEERSQRNCNCPPRYSKLYDFYLLRNIRN